MEHLKDVYLLHPINPIVDIIKSYFRLLQGCSEILQLLTELLKTDGAGSPPHLHLDIVGALHPADGYRFLLIYDDCFTRWLLPLLAHPVKEFLHHWISFGVSSTVTTVTKAQFQSK